MSSTAAELSNPSDATMTTDSRQLGDLSRFEQLDQVRPGNVEEVGRLLGSHGFIVLDDTDVFAGKKHFRCPLDHTGQRIDQVSQGFRRCFPLRCMTDNGGDCARRFFTSSVQCWRAFDM